MQAMGQIPESKTTRTFRPVRQMAILEAKPAVSDCILLLARLMGQYCFARYRLSASVVVVCRCRLSSSVTRVGGRPAGRAAGPAADTARRDSTVTFR